MRINFKNILIVVLIILLLVLTYCNRNYKGQYEEQVELTNTLNSALVTWKTSDSLNVANIEVMQTLRASDFAKIKNLQGTNEELRILVSDYKDRLKKQGSVTILKTETNVQFKDTTKVIYKKDTVYIKDSFSDPWVSLQYNSILCDSILTSTFDLRVNNSYDIILGEISQGVFKDRLMKVEVINKNPYTSTTDIKSYSVKPMKPKRWGVGPMIGFGGYFGDKGIGYGAFIGIGITYNLIQF